MTELLTSTANWLNSGDEVVIEKSPREEPGWWAGAPNATRDEEWGRYYLYYRLRRPRGQGRGYGARIAVSQDGFQFKDVWSIGQEELNSPSIERGHLIRRGNEWVLYLSYVNGETNQWQIDRIAGPSVEQLNVKDRIPVLTPVDVAGHAVKDPFVLRVGPLWYMYVSYAPKELLAPVNGDLHASQDVFTTGAVKSHTGFAISMDGDHYFWQGEVLGSSASGWDSLVSRLSGILPMDGVFLAFYDGASRVEENYEERGGLAVSGDLKHFSKLMQSEPWFQSAYGSARYMCPVVTPMGTILYYEAASSTGSHYLCGRRVSWR